MNGDQRPEGDEVLAEVVRCEQALLDPRVRGQAAVAGDLLHPDFREHGASGRVWTRQALLAAMADDPGVSGQAVGFAPVRLADDVVLLTFEMAGERPSVRASIWVRGPDGRWRIRFHQGTLKPDAADAE